MARRKLNTVAGQPGADPTLPDVTLILGGKERKLCFDFNAIILVSKETGMNLLKSVVSEVEPASLRALLWAALLRDEPSLTLEQVGTLIRPGSIPGIRAAILAAWFQSSPDDEPGQGGATGESKAQTKKV